ncbi:MAG: endonuclease [Paludibacteraceae bacterium]|nr:endonuclease [Paludibacteraceae bacterium]
MKKILTVFASLLCSVMLFAETFTIVFNSGDTDGTNTAQKLTNFVLSSTNNCVTELRSSSKINRAKPGYGIKGGTGSEKGQLTLGLDAEYRITTLTIYAAAYVPANGADTAETRGIIVCGQTIKWEAGHRAEIRPYTITLDKDLDSLSIESTHKSSSRWYAQKIEFEAEDPHPQQALMEMPYILAFENGHWEAEDEPIEDALSFDIIGKHIDGQITLSFQTGKNFTLSTKSLPAAGGEVDVAYSVMLAEITKAFSYKDVIIAKAKGLDGIERTAEIPIEVTITPPSSGSKTLNLDTTCMAIGPMPGNYYTFAQNTADSTLKNHLGAIICCGKRYKYGSGERHSWDAFFHTDRNPATNQVLDMYSNNVRYFNPEKPAASVAEFDIEHMLPKSWWGGDVNPAYCDLYHLVPGDYSANRSKSNHAPGIPSDSTFNNGSFVTGNGSKYGLQRVFCPEDQYKGDFARAYFYIVTCYGDSLRWVETGEPGIAMTNKSWEEFQPWLRDLLLEWHRMDPVSEKEKTRAIEVNKIQGNRNPFIDYPDLAEFIWGNKKGQTVDFNLLEQSFGDPYDENQALDFPQQDTRTRKELRDGQIIIIRNSSIYTILGQPVR